MTLLYVIVGGAVGTALRYFAVLGAARALGAALPFGTLLVNLLGSFVLGALAERFRVDPTWTQELRAGLSVGLCGGFTTYSAFNLETLRLIGDGEGAKAALYVGLTLAGCLAAGLAGAALGRA